MTEAARPRASTNDRILVLAGQGFALGLTMAWIMIPASAIFLANYGPDRLPVTYIGAAFAGVVSSAALGAAFRRRPLAAVAARVLAGLAVALLASWVVLRTAEAEWVSFALLVVVPIVVPVGFVFVVGQAGMLLDVRVLKALYARVVAGFALGFVAGGLAGPPLLARLGRTEDLLLAAATAAAIFLVLVLIARRRYPELSERERVEVDAERPTLRALSRQRYVMLIVAFQMLSAVESQWLDFLVFDRAAQRYADSNELARFISQFSVIAYGTDIVFLMLLAGFLLRRFGLRYGLTANSVGVLTVLAAIVVTSALLGSGATLVFVLIVAARVADLTFSDGTSRTSLSAAYQAVPTRLRPIAQASVEGLAVPVAIGVSGFGLLAVDAVGGTDSVLLPILTAVVVTAWAFVAVSLYREYRENLVANLRGRTLDPAELSVESESSLLAIERLVDSDDERDVRLGLEILTVAQHPELPLRLQILVVDDRVNVRTEALERLVHVAPGLAAAAARDALDDPSPRVQAASIRVLGATRSADDLSRIEARMSDATPEVSVAIAFALSRSGDDAILTDLAAEIARRSRSAAAGDRERAARMLGELDPGPWIDRSMLGALLADPDPAVVNAALRALRGPEDSHLLSAAAASLADGPTAAAAADALVRAGAPALTVVDTGLRSDALRAHAQEQLVRIAREIGGPAAITVLSGHVGHRDRSVGSAVMTAIAALRRSTPAPSPDMIDVAETAVVHAELQYAARVLCALVAFNDAPEAGLLCHGLRDELVLTNRRVLAALAMRHGSEGLSRVVFQLAQRDARPHALALEWLDVTLTGTERAVVALLEPGSSDAERMNALVRRFPVAARSRREVLIDLAHDADDVWRRPWIAACALYTASRTEDDEVYAATAAAAGQRLARSVDDDEAGILHETLEALGERRRDIVSWRLSESRNVHARDRSQLRRPFEI